MRVIRTIGDLEAWAGAVLVPTMGALHEGHLALVRRGVEAGGPVVVSVFVNPTQFGPGEDLDRYPRTLEQDCRRAEQAGATAVFAPQVETVYPPDAAPQPPPLPAVATTPGLEDACRPGHFAGVCQVVARLFDLVRPRAAVFGEKDFQQLRVIQAMVLEGGDRWPGLEIIAHPTVRDEDGLALSSRNVYLEGDHRRRALGLSRALRHAGSCAQPGEAEQAMHSTLRDHDLEIDYAVVRDACTLLPIDTFENSARGLIAARLGEVRLIDNAAVPLV